MYLFTWDVYFIYHWGDSALFILICCVLCLFFKWSPAFKHPSIHVQIKWQLLMLGSVTQQKRRFIVQKPTFMRLLMTLTYSGVFFVSCLIRTWGGNDFAVTEPTGTSPWETEGRHHGTKSLQVCIRLPHPGSVWSHFPAAQHPLCGGEEGLNSRPRQFFATLGSPASRGDGGHAIRDHCRYFPL